MDMETGDQEQLKVQILKENLREAKAKSDLAELMVAEQRQKIEHKELCFNEELRLVKAAAAKAELALVRKKVKKSTVESDSESSSAYLTTPINNQQKYHVHSSSDEEQLTSLVRAIKKYNKEDSSSVPNSP